MTNNEIFNTFLHLTGLWKDTDKLNEIFKLGGFDETLTKSQISSLRSTKKDASIVYDDILECFIQGLFKYRDLKSQQGVQVFNFGIDFLSKK